MTKTEHQDDGPTVYLVDDDPAVRTSLRLSLASAGYHVEAYDSATDFLERYTPERYGCLVLDIRMPVMDGLELQDSLNDRSACLPVVFISGHADIPIAVRAFKAGAVTLLEKPFSKEDLLNSVQDALDRAEQHRSESEKRETAKRRCERLTAREYEVMELVTEGYANKEIARLLDLSPRTVEHHRARVMEKMETRSVPELIALATLC